MNVYDTFFRQITPDDWEFFATDFLFSIGYSILEYPAKGVDGGKDLLVECDGITYLVSCKHYIGSGATVGVNDEQSITDRVNQHKASGFIGFYSTQITSSLSARLEALEHGGLSYRIYDQNRISDELPCVSSFVLQKYGITGHDRFVMNVSDCDYVSLPCLKCKIDILGDDMISSSMAFVLLNERGQLEYIYGCKSCFRNCETLGWVEISQSLHLEELNGWIRYVNDLLKTHSPASSFYLNRSTYEGALQQRMFPSNWGRWFQ